MNEAVWYMEDLPLDEVPVLCFGVLYRNSTEAIDKQAAHFDMRRSVFRPESDPMVKSQDFVAVYSKKHGWMLRADFSPVDVVYAWSPIPGAGTRLPWEDPKPFAEVLASIGKYTRAAKAYLVDLNRKPIPWTHPVEIRVAPDGWPAVGQEIVFAVKEPFYTGMAIEIAGLEVDLPVHGKVYTAFTLTRSARSGDTVKISIDYLNPWIKCPPTPPIHP